MTKTFTLHIKPYSLNQYRNAHFRTLHKLKLEYAEAIAWDLKTQKAIPIKPPVAIVYEFNWKTKHRHDLDNYSATVKFINDVLTPMHPTKNPFGMGILPDDCTKYITSISLRPGRRRDNTVDITIHSVV